MTRLIASLSLLVLPFTINAEPIFIDVDYEGVVDNVLTEKGSRPIVGFQVGQRIQGRLTIDTRLAGPDHFPGDDTFGRYGFQGADFVTSEFRSLTGSSPWDVVNVSTRPAAPGVEPELDPGPYYAIFDRSFIDPSNETQFAVVLSRLSLADDGLLQAFTAEPKRDGSRISAFLLRVKNGVRSAVRFAFDKVSVTPGSCRAP